MLYFERDPMPLMTTPMLCFRYLQSMFSHLAAHATLAAMAGVKDVVLFLIEPATYAERGNIPEPLNTLHLQRLPGHSDEASSLSTMVCCLCLQSSCSSQQMGTDLVF